jgi:hypothetical protein
MLPRNDAATVMPIGAYRTLSSRAATTAAATLPPAPSTEIAAT